jgi:hypothetical protein
MSYPSTKNTPNIAPPSGGFSVSLLDPDGLGYISGYSISSSVVASSVSVVSYAEPELRKIYLLGVNSSVSIKGYFADINGDITGVSFSTTIPQAGGSPWSFSKVSGGIPTTAQFARVVLSGDVYAVSSKTSSISDFQTNTSNYPKIIAITSSYNTFGRGGN